MAIDAGVETLSQLNGPPSPTLIGVRPQNRRVVRRHRVGGQVERQMELRAVQGAGLNPNTPLRYVL